MTCHQLPLDEVCKLVSRQINELRMHEEWMVLTHTEQEICILSNPSFCSYLQQQEGKWQHKVINKHTLGIMYRMKPHLSALLPYLTVLCVNFWDHGSCCQHPLERCLLNLSSFWFALNSTWQKCSLLWKFSIFLSIQHLRSHWSLDLIRYFTAVRWIYSKLDKYSIV